MRLMRNFGFHGYDHVIYPGTNGKMTEISAAMGLTNLEELDDFVATNKANYEAYRGEIESLRGLAMLEFDPGESNNYQYIVLEVLPEFPLSRDRLVEALHAENVLARKYFWPGCHNMEPYRSYYPHAGLVLPNTKRVPSAWLCCRPERQCRSTTSARSHRCCACWPSPAPRGPTGAAASGGDCVENRFLVMDAVVVEEEAVSQAE
jgi:dTDP-4-amino-4,6-dideoxygalactose transaminase